MTPFFTTSMIVKSSRSYVEEVCIRWLSFLLKKGDGFIRFGKNGSYGCTRSIRYDIEGQCRNPEEQVV